MDIIKARRAAISKARRSGKATTQSEPTRPSGYANDRRTGKTHPEKREKRDRKHPKYNLQAGPGYMIKANAKHAENRADRRARRRGTGFVQPAMSTKRHAKWPSIVTAKKQHERLAPVFFPHLRDTDAA